MVNELPETFRTETREANRKRRKDPPHRLRRLAHACVKCGAADYPGD